MSWASRRRFVILTILGATGVAFFAILGTSIFYKTPTCTDGVQNQNEAGIDCGGSCPYLCATEQREPVVLFTKTIANSTGRTDVVAAIQNANLSAAAKNVSYTVTLYGANQVFVQEVTGTIDLPPAATVPVFIPAISTGSQQETRAFLTIAPLSAKWFSVVTAIHKPTVTQTTLMGSTDAPRVSAILSNTAVAPMTNVRAVVFIHDEKGAVIAASATVIPTIPAQGQAEAMFTWNTAFPGTPVTIEVVPVVLLP